MKIKKLVLCLVRSFDLVELPIILVHENISYSHDNSDGNITVRKQRLGCVHIKKVY